MVLRILQPGHGNEIGGTFFPLSRSKTMLRTRILFLLLIISASFSTYAQSLSKFKELSRPEKWWVITHPFIAKKTFHLTQEVLRVCDSLKNDSTLDGDANGGQLDAFRHGYWMCVLVQHISFKKAYKLGLAHEKGNKISFTKHQLEDSALPDSVSCLMDLMNNQVGIQLGRQNRFIKDARPLSDRDLIFVIKQQILKGSLFKILKTKKGLYVTCEGALLDVGSYKGKWGAPKCLVASNAIRF
jgi:hypothetical protein